MNNESNATVKTVVCAICNERFETVAESMEHDHLKSDAAETVPAGTVGKGKSIHMLILAGSAPYANCGAGLGRPGDVQRSRKDLPLSAVSCKRCHARKS